MEKRFFLNKASKQIIIEHRLIDPWFPFRFSLNVFSGCEYDCLYCRANWREGKKIIYKENILPLLEKEILNLKIKPYSLIGVGGGINETFSFNETKNQKAMRVIECLLSYKLQPIIITKNLIPLLQFKKTLLRYDKNILPIVIYGYSGLSEDHQNLLEKNVPKINFSLLNEIKQVGFSLGILYAPIIPSINDTLNEIEKMIVTFNEVGIDFFLLNHLDFPGLFRLNAHFREELFSRNQALITSYLASKRKYEIHCQKLTTLIYKKLIQAKIGLRIPHRLFHQKMSFKDELTVILYHLYFYKQLLNEEKSIFFYRAASLISRMPKEKWTLKLEQRKLTDIRGLGKSLPKTIYDMAFKGDFSYLKRTLEKVNQT